MTGHHAIIMSFDIYDIIAYTLSASETSRIKSKTTMQKLIYFHTTKIPNITSLNYVPHFYGPYSNRVSIALSEMSEFSFIHEKIFSEYYDTFEYSLTENGVDYVDKAKETFQDEYDVIKNTVDICASKPYELKPTPLSYAAKTHYIKTHYSNASNPKDIVNKATELGWNMSIDDIKEGTTLLKDLALD